MTALIKANQLMGNNFNTWSDQHWEILRKNKVSNYCIAEKQKLMVTDVKTLALWIQNEKNQKSDIFFIIYCNIWNIDKFGSPKKIRDPLRKIFEAKGLTKQILLSKKNLTIYMERNNDLEKQTTEFYNIAKKLQDFRIIGLETMLVVPLVCNLPPAFKEFFESSDKLLSLKTLQTETPEVSSIQKKMHSKKSYSRYQAKTGAKLRKSKPSQKNRIKCHGSNRLGYTAKKHCFHREKLKQSTRQLKKNNEVVIIKQSDKSTILITVEEIMQTGVVKNNWCMDGVCTNHMSNEKNLFKEFIRLNIESKIDNSVSTSILGSGNVHIVVDTDENNHQIIFQNKYYVTDLRTNLLSVAKATDNGCEVTFRQHDAFITDKTKKVILRGDRKGNLYYVRKSTTSQITEVDLEEVNAMTIFYMSKLNTYNIYLKLYSIIYHS